MSRLLIALFTILLVVGCTNKDKVPKEGGAEHPLAQALGISGGEAVEVENFLDNFYREDLTDEEMTAQMMRVPKKFYSKAFDGKQAGAQVEPMDNLAVNQLVVSAEKKEELSEAEKSHPLFQAAQAKGTDAFYKYYCENVLKKKFPKLKCEEVVDSDREQLAKEESLNPRATAEWNDQVTSLTDSWIDKSAVKLSLDDIKTEASTRLPLWSDDYWAIAGGVTSARYVPGFESNTNGSKWRKNIEAYTQPGRPGGGESRAKILEWNPLVSFLNDSFSKVSNFLDQQNSPWSPAEKLDVTAGDLNFTLTNEQKQEGSRYEDAQGNVETWMGICHGWAAASIMVPPAESKVTLTGAKGVKVQWHRHDIAAIQQLAWANGGTQEFVPGRGWQRGQTNFVGGRCNVKDPRTYANGRLKDQDCFDNNPATFVLALGNMIGEKGLSFVMDKTFNYEVWNQPVEGYKIVYFHPNNPRQHCSDWRKCAVSYKDRTFQRRDRFSKPLMKTRGTRTRSGVYNDSNVDYVVGFVVTVSYISEAFPTANGYPSDKVVLRVTYSGDLEIDQQGDQYLATGGEWHQNAHPDFLWVPRRNSIAHLSVDDDDSGIGFTGTETPSEDVATAAREGSRQGYPICQIVKELTNKSMDQQNKHLITPKYVCPADDDITDWPS